MIQTIPLGKLVPSPRNVRRHVDEQADLELKADIAAHGLLQNLVVTAAKKPRGSFAVVAGERRRRALQALADEGALDTGYEVPCLVVGSDGDAYEASLAENFQRLAMNPADECLAFGQLIEQGSDIAGVARRFGLTERFVEGRLRLAELAQPVFEALGAGIISLDVAKAYAATADQERQAWVFEQMSGYGQHPDSVRRMMTQATVAASDRRAKLVGEEAYIAAGGRIERDLFAEEADARWLDVPLLERLANERMDAAASEVLAASGLAFVRPTLDCYVGYGRLDGLARVPLDTPPLTDEEKAEIDRLQSEIDALALTLEDEDAEQQAADAAEAKVDELAARIEAIADKPPVLGDEEKATLGAFLLLGDDGVPVLDRSYFREVAEEAVEGESRQAGEDRPASGSDDGRMGGSLPEFQAPSLSQRLADELAIQRRDILAFHLAADPAVAFDLAVFVMADRVAGEGWRDQAGSSLTAVRPQDPVTGFMTPDAAATQGREQVRESLDRSWIGHDTCVARFEAFRALPDVARQAWLGELVARTLEASLNAPGLRNRALHDHLGQVLGIEVARWWRPTGANYFDRVSKAVALDAMAEVGGAELAARYAKAKKAEVAGACERLFAGELVVEAEVRAAALAWVPEAMRFAVLEHEAEQVDAEPDVDEGEASGVSDVTDDDPQIGLGEGAPAPAPLEEAA